MENITAQTVLEELAAIGLAKATDYLSISDGELIVRQLDQLTPAQASAVASIERSSSGLKVKFYDKLKALELLGSQLGMFGGSQQQTVPENNLLEAILNSTQQEVNMDDLSEIQ
jgi:hypothetical protein